MKEFKALLNNMRNLEKCMVAIMKQSEEGMKQEVKTEQIYHQGRFDGAQEIHTLLASILKHF